MPERAAPWGRKAEEGLSAAGVQERCPPGPGRPQAPHAQLPEALLRLSCRTHPARGEVTATVESFIQGLECKGLGSHTSLKKCLHSRSQVTSPGAPRGAPRWAEAVGGPRPRPAAGTPDRVPELPQQPAPSDETRSS